MKIILGSGSPRRKELLGMLGLDFTVIPAQSEQEVSPLLGPDENVKQIALAKAVSVAKTLSDCATADDTVIIAADTIVYLCGAVLGKPRDNEDAKAMLRALSGQRHTVYTGVALLHKGVQITAAESTDVWFRQLLPGEIDAYVETGDPMDKAGAYGAQGHAAKFIERIDGDFFNVMGLPLCRLTVMLRELGVKL